MEESLIASLVSHKVYTCKLIYEKLDQQEIRTFLFI
jgi:hypothetical protein